MLCQKMDRFKGTTRKGVEREEGVLKANPKTIWGFLQKESTHICHSLPIFLLGVFLFPPALHSIFTLTWLRMQCLSDCAQGYTISLGWLIITPFNMWHWTPLHTKPNRNIKMTVYFLLNDLYYYSPVKWRKLSK